MMNIKTIIMGLSIMGVSQSYAILPEEVDHLKHAKAALSYLIPSSEMGYGFALLTTLGLVTPPLVPVITTSQFVVPACICAYAFITRK
jgi:hypothetical protein